MSGSSDHGSRIASPDEEDFACSIDHKRRTRRRAGACYHPCAGGGKDTPNVWATFGIIRKEYVASCGWKALPDGGC